MKPFFLRRRVSPISLREFFLFIEAAGALCIAWAAIKILPFKTLMRTTDVGRVNVTRSAADTRALGNDVRRAVERAARRLPWTLVCFPQGLAAHWMLRLRGENSQLHYGLRPSPAQLSAHVWVILAGETIVGEERDNAHSCVAVFPRALEGAD